MNRIGSRGNRLILDRKIASRVSPWVLPDINIIESRKHLATADLSNGIFFYTEGVNQQHWKRGLVQVEPDQVRQYLQWRAISHLNNGNPILSHALGDAQYWLVTKRMTEADYHELGARGLNLIRMTLDRFLLIGQGTANAFGRFPFNATIDSLTRVVTMLKLVVETWNWLCCVLGPHVELHEFESRLHAELHEIATRINVDLYLSLHSPLTVIVDTRDARLRLEFVYADDKLRTVILDRDMNVPVVTAENVIKFFHRHEILHLFGMNMSLER